MGRPSVIESIGESDVRSAFDGQNSTTTSGHGETAGDYPMDFYADQSLGEWTPRHGMGVKRTGGEKGRPIPKSKRAAMAAAAAAAAAAPATTVPVA